MRLTPRFELKIVDHGHFQNSITQVRSKQHLILTMNLGNYGWYNYRRFESKRVSRLSDMASAYYAVEFGTYPRSTTNRPIVSPHSYFVERAGFQRFAQKSVSATVKFVLPPSSHHVKQLSDTASIFR